MTKDIKVEDIHNPVILQEVRHISSLKEGVCVCVYMYVYVCMYSCMYNSFMYALYSRLKARRPLIQQEVARGFTLQED